MTSTIANNIKYNSDDSPNMLVKHEETLKQPNKQPTKTKATQTTTEATQTTPNQNPHFRNNLNLNDPWQARVAASSP
jgi:hypothetical protein